MASRPRLRSAEPACCSAPTGALVGSRTADSRAATKVRRRGVGADAVGRASREGLLTTLHRALPTSRRHSTMRFAAAFTARVRDCSTKQNKNEKTKQVHRAPCEWSITAACHANCRCSNFRNSCQRLVCVPQHSSHRALSPSRIESLRHLFTPAWCWCCLFPQQAQTKQSNKAIPPHTTVPASVAPSVTCPWSTACVQHLPNHPNAWSVAASARWIAALKAEASRASAWATAF